MVSGSLAGIAGGTFSWGTLELCEAERWQEGPAAGPVLVHLLASVATRQPCKLGSHLATAILSLGPCWKPY